MPTRDRLLEIAVWLRTVAEAGVPVSTQALHALARDLERVAARDAWVPHSLAALALITGFVGGLLWHAYVP